VKARPPRGAPRGRRPRPWIPRRHGIGCVSDPHYRQRMQAGVGHFLYPAIACLAIAPLYARLSGSITPADPTVAKAETIGSVFIVATGAWSGRSREDRAIAE